MSYDGKEVLAWVAREHGWTVGQVRVAGGWIVAYESAFGAQAVVRWTDDRCATSILLAKLGEGQHTVLRGPGALIDLRSYIEANPVNLEESK